jgi:hypothetical protein
MCDNKIKKKVSASDRTIEVKTSMYSFLGHLAYLKKLNAVFKKPIKGFFWRKGDIKISIQNLIVSRQVG